jgi:radical SAM protein with 4Fe4S-binding SPASM domain
MDEILNFEVHCLGLSKLLEKIILKFIAPSRELPLQIDITNACNLNCSHCYHSNHINKNTLDLSQWKTVLKQYEEIIKTMGYQPNILVCGGEPLTSPIFVDVLKSIKETEKSLGKECRIGILTNGTLAHKLSHEAIETLQSFKNVCFQVSLEGPEASSHDLIRGQGAFDKAINGIHFLQNHGFKVRIASVLSTQTVGQIKDMFELALKLNVEEINFARLIEVGTAKTHSSDNSTLKPLELKEAYEKILIASSTTGVRTDLHKPLMHLIQQGLGRSGRFFEGLVVDHQGNILASSRSRLKLGHVFKEGLTGVFYENPILKSIRKGQIEKCGECKFSKICGGDRNAAYASTGNYLGPDPGCWLGIQN